jgi:hypothetical protein
VLDDEGTHLPVVVPRPHHDEIRDRAVADPSLGAVEHPAVPVTTRTGVQAHDVGTVVGLGQGEGSEPVRPRHRRQPARLLLLGPEHADRGHRQPAVHDVERADAPVGTRELSGDQTLGERRHRRTSRAAQRAAGHPQLPVPGHEREGELRAFPVVVGDRDHGCVAPRTHPVADRALLVGEHLLEPVEIAGDGRRLLAGGAKRSDPCRSLSRSRS